jgi:protein TonB
MRWIVGFVLALIAVTWSAMAAIEKPLPVSDPAVVTQPQLIEKVNPTYPEDARNAKVSGIVVLEAVIDKTGAVGDIKTIKEPDASLGKAAVDAVKQWRYKPARLKNGDPVAVVMTVTVAFKLKDE